MNDAPLISVLMTSYNCEAYIAEAIDSALNQTFPHFELLIADDASTDRTRDIIARYSDPRIRTDHNAVNLHYLRTRNRLIGQARGKYIALLDADDRAQPQFLEKLLAAFEADPELALCGTFVNILTPSGKITGTRSKPTDNATIRRKLAEENQFLGSAVMLRTSVVRALGGYREFFSGIGNEDWDLAVRIAQHHACANLPEVLYDYRQHAASASRSNFVTDPMKRHLRRVMHLLIAERNATGSDAIDRGEAESIYRLVAEWEEESRRDPARIHREIAGSHLYSRLYGAALRSAWRAVLAGPGKLINYRTFLYCLRKAMTRGTNH